MINKGDHDYEAAIGDQLDKQKEKKGKAAGISEEKTEKESETVSRSLISY